MVALTGEDSATTNVLSGSNAVSPQTCTFACWVVTPGLNVRTRLVTVMKSMPAPQLAPPVAGVGSTSFTGIVDALNWTVTVLVTGRDSVTGKAKVVIPVLPSFCLTLAMLSVGSVGVGVGAWACASESEAASN